MCHHCGGDLSAGSLIPLADDELVNLDVLTDDYTYLLPPQPW
jgi:hypothetical protein